jgi:hypothetical protein
MWHVQHNLCLCFTVMCHVKHSEAQGILRTLNAGSQSSAAGVELSSRKACDANWTS